VVSVQDTALDHVGAVSARTESAGRGARQGRARDSSNIVQGLQWGLGRAT